MPDSIQEQATRDILQAAKARRVKRVTVDGETREISVPFPSPEDWRDHFIYFLMVDRFDNPSGPPRHQPYDIQVGEFQGGTFEGIRQRLGYLQELGVGALWLTPVLQNCQFLSDTYHGYGIQHFLRLDSRFASNKNDPEAELQTLIDEAHARGIYVIFDIVLNHTGDTFAYVLDSGQRAGEASFRDNEYRINWRDEQGQPNPDWEQPPASAGLSRDAAVWPTELRRNEYFLRKGSDFDRGDFFSLKGFVKTNADVRRYLIMVYQYLIAKFDIDGFRIDTLKYIGEDFALLFGNAIREYALRIGKKNFFTFGEVFDEEEKISHFIGRRTTDQGDLVGVDASLDFPLFFRLPSVAKGLAPVSNLVELYQRRKQIERDVISSHGEASRFFVTFIDNHDGLGDFKSRFYYRDSNNPDRYNDQVALGIACLFGLQGIPCLYYGTEQGLSGHGNSDRALREALWGKPGGFDRHHPFYQAIASIAQVRASHPALRYGRQYFRPVSLDRTNYGVSRQIGGVLAVSRILSDDEIVVVANTSSERAVMVWVIVDSSLNSVGAQYRLLFSNKTSPTPPGAVENASTVRVAEPDGGTGQGPLRIIEIRLQPMEVQVLGQ